jgi:general secretion pathway protein G
MSAIGRQKLCRGFSLFELVVVISIVAVLMSIFLGRVLYYQEQAEKSAMVEVAGAIQSALIMQYGRILTRGKTSDVEWLTKDNPMNWLQKRPPNYVGEFHAPTPLTVEPGNWVFDPNSRDLIYVPRIVDNFKPGKDGRQWIRYHVVVQYEPSRLPSLQNEPHELTGILFEPVEPYAWF